MITNYLKIALRNLWKNRLFSLINILGLSLGLMVAILILLYVRTELSYDNFFEHGDQIYRVLRKADLNGVPYLIGVTSAPYATALQTDFPQTIKAAARVMKGQTLVSYENNSFLEDNFYAVDPNFFEFFSFPLAQGNPATVLENPNSVVLTQQMVQKYFGDSDPVGLTLRIDEETDLIVTGVMAKAPGRSHLDIDFVSSLDLYKETSWYHDWWSNGLFTYVRIKNSAEAGNLKPQLAGFMDKYFGKDFVRSGNRIDLELQPLSDVYFMNEVRYDDALHGNATAVKIFFTIALFILLIAAINYMNLATARAGRRVREIGVRKVLGASPGRLILQFLAESFLLTFAAILIAVAAVEILLPYFNAQFNLDLSINFTEPFVLLLLSLLLLGGALLAGSYPAFLLSSFQPVRVLKGGMERMSGNVLLRKVLVVFQFTVSVVLVVVTLLVGKQMDFLRSKDLGFNDQQIVLVQMNNERIRSQRKAFKDRLVTEPGIQRMTFISGEPGGFHDTMSHEVEGHDQNLPFRTVFADDDYVSTFGMKIVAGRDLSRKFGTDANEAVLINETSARLLGWSNEAAIGKRIKNIFVDTTYRQIVGVVQDFHFASLKKIIEPLVISPIPRVREVAIKINASDIPLSLSKIEKHWKKIAPAYPLEFTFLDDSFFNLYRQEQKESTLFKFFSIVSIFIACLGIFALASFAAEERTKEIGIRKVLGASGPAIVRLLSVEFLLLVAFASLIAWPVAWYAMNKWLQNFAYRVDIGWLVFLLAGGLALVIALVTVSTQAIRAALANPVQSLRYE